jgi:ubiquinone/menaquinone biosynthesis C-methylase UbiE
VTVAERMSHVLPRADLGDEVLEIGPGYGATTRVLAESFARLTAVEVDGESAARLAVEFADRARIVHASGADMPFADNGFSGVTCFTMLHHVPSPELQDDLFAEACRVLAPGGMFAGSDSQLSERFRMLHVGDTMVVVEPDTLPDRLATAGFADIHVERGDGTVLFWATKP